MMACNKRKVWLCSICLTPFVLGVLFATAWAESNIRVNVKTVLASQDEAYIDPALSAVVKELESLFRYSSYRLLSENRLNLALKKTGSVNLPGERVLMITPTGIQADRVEMKLVILRKNSQVFETVIQLLNRGSIIVGGPKHQNGSLLFSISASY